MLKLFLLFCLLPCLLRAQEARSFYNNILKDHRGTPIVGASIVNQTTRQATITTSTGYFSIAAKAGDVIRISYVGLNSSEVIVTPAMLNTPFHKQEAQVIREAVVEPVLSADYKRLVRSAAAADGYTDTLNNIQYAGLRVKNSNFNLPIKEVHIQNNELLISPVLRRRMSLGGSYQSSVEMNKANQQPVLQREYVQGRPVNGALVWQGPETGEMFSFGPAIQSLEYDGSRYAYDVNGRLVPKGSGNGNPAKAYNNAVLRTAAAFTQSLHFHSNYYTENNYVPLLFLRLGAGQTAQSTIIQQNINSNKNGNITLGTNGKNITITGTFSYKGDHFSNSNRNGLLARVYGNALLTPVSFNNSEGYLLQGRQRSFSSTADNPFFLLRDNGNGYQRTQKTGALTLEQKWKKVNVKITQSAESIRGESNENYKEGTVFFDNGMHLQRQQWDRNYFLQAKADINLRPKSDPFTSSLFLYYNLGNARTTIDYTTPAKIRHQYQRTTQDVSVNSVNSYRNNIFDATLNAASKLYFSNTATKSALWLPSLSGAVRFDDVLQNVQVKLTSGYHSFVRELPIHQSFAAAGWLQYLPQQAFHFIPKQEVTGYNELKPIQQKEWNNSIEISYQNQFVFKAETFSRNIKDNIFPVFENGALHLQNIAGHRNRGIEFNLTYNKPYRFRTSFSTSHSLSFFKYQDKVTAVADGYNRTPLAGFSTIHKAIVQGQPLGVIKGTAWLRDRDHNLIIDDDGFPLPDTDLSVIGNPIPHFVIKLNNRLSWKKWTLNIDWEWRKGGDIWNGTAAVLDYYGRSQTTATERNWTGYVFNGVLQNGQKNSIPVSFLNTQQPVEQNRWTRYGYTGVGEAYMQDGSFVKLNTLSLVYQWKFRKYVSDVTLSGYIGNFFLWSAAKGADPNTLLFDGPQSAGLQFFNIPSTKTVGIAAAVQF